jgi:alcohol dehydrogenase class IV
MITPFAYDTTRSIFFGEGTARRIAVVAAGKIGGRCLFVTDPALIDLGVCAPALEALEAAGIEVVVFSEVAPDPTVDILLAATDAGRRARADSVIGFGGGSSMDVAKLAALLLGSGEDLDEAWGIANAKGPRLPLILVPTTAGTGSEVTPISIITVGAEEKRGVSSSVILPDLAILDPELTLGLPPTVTAATGIDAMVHAIEAYASKSANNNPVSRLLAREALRLLGANIRVAVEDGGNLEARGAMLLGSMLAGQAFANSPVAAVHALAYPIGGTFHVPHGLSNALVLPHVLRFNAIEAAVTYAEIAHDAFPWLGLDGDPDLRSAAFIEALEDLSRGLGLQTRLRDVGIPYSAIDKMARDAMLQQRLLVNNPRALEEADAREIYRAAW